MVKETEAPAPAVESLSHRQILVVFSGLMLGMLLAALDQTIVSVSLPTIVGELGGLEKLSWVVTAYLLTSTAVVPLYGKISDIYGRKIVFQAAIVIFLAGSILAGLSQSMVQLIVFRGVQGLGAGGLMVLAMAIIGDIVSPRQRGRYTGYMFSVFALSSIGGPLIGGFLVDSLSWRWIFYVNIPVGIVALVVTSSVLRLPFRSVRHRIDFAGAALLVASVSCVQLVLVWGGNHYAWSSPVIVALAIGSALLLAGFLIQETRTAEPVLPLRLFSESIFSVSTSLSFLIGMAMFGGMVFLPVYLQAVSGTTPTGSGLLMLPLMAGVMTTSIWSGRRISRTGRYKVWPVAGSVLTLAGFVLLSRIDPSTPRAVTSAFMLVLGAGMGMSMQVLVLVVQNAVSHADLGVATSAVNFFRSMGGTFGTALFGAIFAARLRVELPRLVPGAAARDMSRLVNSPARIRALPPPVRDGVIEALSRSVHSVFIAAVPMVAVAVLVALALREIPLRDTVHIGAVADA
jgi:EmrB/QacA subfamily drug resistance transporter